MRWPGSSEGAKDGEQFAPLSSAPVVLALAILAACLLAAYANSFHGPFVFDDVPAILGNRTIRDLTDWRAILSPPENGITVEGRPLLNASLALNYALSGTEVWSYHVTNLLIHLLAVCLLFGVVRQIAILAQLDAAGVAFVTALLWGVHPLQTESVTYVIQRAESLAGLWYLLAVYSFLVSATVEATSSTGRIHRVISVGAFGLGVLTKETVVTAPVVIALLDRAMIAGSFAKAWRARRGYYVAMTLILLGFLAWKMWTGLTRSGTAGFGTGISPLYYFLTQLGAVPEYLRSVIWPYPLVFDYGTGLVRDGIEVLPQAIILAIAAGACLYGIFRNGMVALSPAVFLLLLAPSSSIVPVASQTIAEHRMYLPLAAVVIGLVFGVAAWWGRPGLIAVGLLALPLGWLTFERNKDYANRVALYTSVVRARPENPRAHYNLGTAYEAEGSIKEAISSYRKAIEKAPDYADAWVNLGNAAFQSGSLREADACYRAAIRHAPAMADAHFNLGNLLSAEGKMEQAIASYEKAISIKPRMSEAHGNLASALMRAGRKAEAARHFKAAVEIGPDSPSLRCQLAGALMASGERAQAEAEYQKALGIDANWPAAHYGLGNVRWAVNDLLGAERHFRRAAVLSPEFIEARNNLAAVLLQARKVSEAVVLLRELAAQRPDDRQIQYNFGYALAADGQLAGAINQYERTLALGPDVPVNLNLANLLWEVGRTTAAESHYRQAVKLAPSHYGAHLALGMLLLRTDRPEEAAVVFQRAAELRNDAVDALYGLGLSHQALGQPEQAVVAFEEILRKAPSHRDAQAQLEEARRRISAK